MAQHKGQFIAIAGFADQGDGKGQDGPPGPVDRLKRVGRLAGPVVDHNLEIAIGHPAQAAAIALCHRFDARDDSDKVFGRLIHRENRRSPSYGDWR
jgi:hypothetical protein